MIVWLDPRLFGPGTGILAWFQYAICHRKNLAICHMLFQILTYMQYANEISRGSAREMPGRASFWAGSTAPNTNRLTSQRCLPTSSSWKRRSEATEEVKSKRNRLEEHNWRWFTFNVPSTYPTTTSESIENTFYWRRNSENRASIVSLPSKCQYSLRSNINIWCLKIL
jgi:hypothetical protein